MTTYQADFPVFDLSNNFVGVITRSRLVVALRSGTNDQRVSDIMIPAREVPVVTPDTNLADIWDRMMEERSQVVAVKEAGRFLGLITLADISEVIQVMGAAQEGNGSKKVNLERNERLTQPSAQLPSPTTTQQPSLPAPQSEVHKEDVQPEEQKPG